MADPKICSAIAAIPMTESVNHGNALKSQPFARNAFVDDDFNGDRTSRLESINELPLQLPRKLNH
jgi:hypothetical protein